MAKTYGMMRLGRDAEMRYTPSGEAVCNLSLAVTYGKKGADGYYPTQWIDAALWGKRAETLAPFLTKGSMHCFTLRDVHIETYTGKDGYEAYKLAATVEDVELGGKGSSGGETQAASGTGEGAKRRPAAGGDSRPAPTQRQPVQPDLDESDIPF